MAESERKLVKRAGSAKYELNAYSPDDDLRQIKGYTKEELKENYKLVKMQYEQLLHACNASKKKIKSITVEDTPVLREILANMEKATRLAEKEKYEEQVKEQDKEIAFFKKQLKEIELVVPEVLRSK